MAGPRFGLVGADALEDPGAVVQAVRADVDRRVRPVHELAVHPDLLGLVHVGRLLAVGRRNGTARRAELPGYSETSAVCARVDGASSVRASPAMCRSSRRRPRRARARAAALDAAPARRPAPGTARPRPARSPSRPSTSAGLADARRRAPRGRRDLRRVGAAVAGHEHQHGRPSQSKSSDLTICAGAQPTASAAAASPSACRAGTPRSGRPRPLRSRSRPARPAPASVPGRKALRPRDRARARPGARRRSPRRGSARPARAAAASRS